jgi:hypothetical protein
MGLADRVEENMRERVSASLAGLAPYPSIASSPKNQVKIVACQSVKNATVIMIRFLQEEARIFTNEKSEIS